jgi:6,7-dimethyl-8-ribityllumazine synthase
MKIKILIVNAHYYSNISKDLVSDAKLTLDRNKAKYETIDVAGVFEIPVIIAKNIKKYDGFIALGCVIKGETPHFEFISKTTINAIMKLSVKSKKPIGNGILTCMNISQASARSDPKGEKRKGKEAAEAVLSVLGFKT